MTEKSTLRSGMLNTIYNMLPAIDDDYAARLVYTLEDKKSIDQLKQDVADTAARLNSDSPAADTLVAQMLLDEITLPAALRQLRIYCMIQTIPFDFCNGSISGIGAPRTKDLLEPELLEFVRQRVDPRRMSIAFDQIDEMRCPLSMAEPTLYNDIMDLVEEWCINNAIDPDSVWSVVDVEDIFWEL